MTSLCQPGLLSRLSTQGADAAITPERRLGKSGRGVGPPRVGAIRPMSATNRAGKAAGASRRLTFDDLTPHPHIPAVAAPAVMPRTMGLALRRGQTILPLQLARDERVEPPSVREERVAARKRHRAAAAHRGGTAIRKLLPLFESCGGDRG